MPLAVGDVGSVIDLDIYELNSSGNVQAAEFDTSNDTVSFVFVFSDGTRLSQLGTWVTSSRARYTTVLDDISTAGRCELQLQIDGSLGSGWVGSSEVLILEIGKKL